MGLAEKMNKAVEKYGDKKRESFERTTSTKLVRSTNGEVYAYDKRTGEYKKHNPIR